MRTVAPWLLVVVVVLAACHKDQQKQEVPEAPAVPVHFYATSPSPGNEVWIQAFPGPQDTIWSVSTRRSKKGGPIKVAVSRSNVANQVLESEEFEFPSHFDVLSVDSVNEKKPVILISERFIAGSPWGILKLRVWKEGATSTLNLPIFTSAESLVGGSENIIRDVCYSTNPIYLFSDVSHFQFRQSPADEGYYLTVSTCGYTQLFYYDANADRVWDRYLTKPAFVVDDPKRLWSLKPTAPWSISVDDAGNVYSVVPVQTVFQATELMKEWGRAGTPAVVNVRYAAQITKKDKTSGGGALIEAEFGALMSGVTPTPNSPVVFGSKFVPKPGGPGDNFEREFWALEFNDKFDLKQQKVLDIHLEDNPLCLLRLENGDFISVVESGFKQMDSLILETTSDLSIVRLAPDLSIKSHISFGSPLTDGADECRRFDGDKLLFSGSWNVQLPTAPDDGFESEGYWAWLPLFGW